MLELVGLSRRFGEVVALDDVSFSVAATVALVPLATRIYSAAVLRPGRVRIRQALRASRG